MSRAWTRYSPGASFPEVADDRNHTPPAFRSASSVAIALSGLATSWACSFGAPLLAPEISTSTASAHVPEPGANSIVASLSSGTSIRTATKSGSPTSIVWSAAPRNVTETSGVRFAAGAAATRSASVLKSNAQWVNVAIDLIYKRWISAEWHRWGRYHQSSCRGQNGRRRIATGARATGHSRPYRWDWCISRDRREWNRGGSDSKRFPFP